MSMATLVRLVPEPYVVGHETICLEEAQGAPIEPPGVQGDQGYSQGLSARLGGIQKQGAHTLSAGSGSHADVVDVDLIVREVPWGLRAPDNLCS